MDIRPIHIFNPQQGKVLESIQRFILYSGGYGCGKTLFGVYWVLMKASYENNTGAIYCPTLKMLSDNILRPNLLPIFNYCLGEGNFRLYKAPGDLYIKLVNGSEIRLRSFDDEGTIRGADLNWVWLDEAIGKERTYLTEARFNQIKSRIRLERKNSPPSQMLITTNPASNTHFLYKFFQDDIRKTSGSHIETKYMVNNVVNKSVVYSSVYDNRHLPTEYIKDMEKTYSKEELEGLWTKQVGAVYQDFSINTHVREFKPDPNWEYILCIDWGYTNPCAALVVGIDNDYNYWVCDEHYIREHLVREITPIWQTLFLDKYPIYYFIADPADPEKIQQTVHDLEIGHITAQAKRKSVKRGIDAVKKKLRIKSNGEPSLIVHPRCKELISEFHSYAWKLTTDGEKTEEPEKRNDHGLDALRYLCKDREGYERSEI